MPTSTHSHSYNFGVRAKGGRHGVVLTQPQVVRLMLDWVGYVQNRDLFGLRFLEPSCGQGAFVLPAVERLLASARIHKRNPAELGKALLAVDVDPQQIEIAREKTLALLLENGVSVQTAQRLVSQWFLCDDFLLSPIAQGFDVVVGNPPYVRYEQIPKKLHKEYRARFSCLYDRADLYVAFIERALSLLSTRGVLAFICADRWTRNRYGAPLRKLLSEQYVIRGYLDLSQRSPFDAEVSAYPSIFSVAQRTASNNITAPVPVIALPTVSEKECNQAMELLRSPCQSASETESDTSSHGSPTLHLHPTWFQGEEPWVFGDARRLTLLRKLEAEHPLLEECGNIRVGIGVATGNDSLYILSEEDAKQIEADRLVPLILRKDLDKLRDGKIENGRHFVINTFAENGQPISLSSYPLLHSYFQKHEADIRKRHVAKRNPNAWFRTIDRVYPELQKTPKLLIPDIANFLQVVFDPGHHYPHHNLYHITATDVDLEVLGGLLSSHLALLFISSYAVQMRGGAFRFQAQYLRKIRIPKPATLSSKLKEDLRQAFRTRDLTTLDKLAQEAYRIETMPPIAYKRA